jgi:hypothetical protein
MKGLAVSRSQADTKKPRIEWPFQRIAVGGFALYSRDEDSDRANAAMKYVHTYMQGNDRKFSCKTHKAESGERILVITRIS